MKIEESFNVPTSIQRVWDFVADPKEMASCLPAVQSVEVLDDRHYDVVVKQKIGFISATFKIQTEVLEKEAPSRLGFQLVRAPFWRLMPRIKKY